MSRVGKAFIGSITSNANGKSIEKPKIKSILKHSIDSYKSLDNKTNEEGKTVIKKKTDGEESAEEDKGTIEDFSRGGKHFDQQEQHQASILIEQQLDALTLFVLLMFQVIPFLIGLLKP